MRKIQPGDPESMSQDTVAENIEQLRVLFPEAWTENKLDFDVLRQLLGDVVDDREEKYGLNWHGKRNARRLALTPSHGTLRPCPNDSVDWNTTQNLMIEGDNLEVLKLLQKSYSGKVKLIYIDPPYNTGRDFVYPDDYRDSIKNYHRITGQSSEEGARETSNTDSSGRFHTNWLNMIYPRLKLAQHLLKQDGLLFFSCDDSEIASARSVFNEIFGEENFVECLVWKKRYGGGAKEKYFVSLHEYILVYSKDIGSIEEIFVPLSESSIERYYSSRDEFFEERGPFRTHPLEAMKSFEDRPNLRFPVLAPDGSEVWPKRQWRWSKEKMEDALSKSEVLFTRNRDGAWVLSSKQYLKGSDGENRSAKVFSVIDGIYTQAGTSEVVELFGDARVFPFTKPSELIRTLVQLGTVPNQAELVLDFFAGSGTTAEAVLKQNLSDGGNRRFILVQLPELLRDGDRDTGEAAAFCERIGRPKKISEITKERLRRVSEKLRVDAELLGESDVGFRAFRLDSSNINSWDPDSIGLDETLIRSIEHIKSDRDEADVLYELLVKLGLDLCVPIEQHAIAEKVVYSVGAGVLFVCLDPKISRADAESLALGIIHLHKRLNPAAESSIVFRDSGFEDDVTKTNITAILQQYGLGNIRSL
jgi:adenine-specific DNA-methyltransferase